MNITAFNPIIITKDPEPAIALFEALGFERKHMKTGINDKDITSVDLKHPNGFRVDVVKSDAVPQDITSIRMNVRDFDEAYEYLISKGFRNAQGDKVTDTGSSKATMMVSPSGYSINLVEHIRKDG